MSNVRYADYVQVAGDDRVIVRANRADEGPCPDRCGRSITSGDAITHTDGHGWVLATHRSAE
jgi:hypothetical protein